MPALALFGNPSRRIRPSSLVFGRTWRSWRCILAPRNIETEKENNNVYAPGVLFFGLVIRETRAANREPIENANENASQSHAIAIGNTKQAAANHGQQHAIELFCELSSYLLSD